MAEVLIFTMSIGGGHNQAAKNLKDALEKKKVTVKIIDAMQAISARIDTAITDSYLNLAGKIPAAYGRIYRTSNTINASRFILRSLNAVARNKILTTIRKEEPKLIIATHPFVVSFVSRLRRKEYIDIPFMSVVTDFVAHRLYLSPYVDKYIVASPQTKNRMIRDGIDENRVHAYGIPINPKFFRKRKNKVNHTPYQILMMGGALGFGSLENIVDQIMQMKEKILLHVVCGNNEEMRLQLEEHYSSYIHLGKLVVEGFVHNVDELMDQADCIITKPGGLTATESICKRLPMIIPFYVPGQEEENTDFLTYNGMARVTTLKHSISEILKKFMNEPEIPESLQENMDQLANSYSMDKTIGVAFSLIHKYETRNFLTQKDRRELKEIFPFILKNYSPEYPSWYESEKERLIRILSTKKIFRINHIGSSAVKGLISKPCIDILLEIKGKTDINEVKTALLVDDWLVVKKEEKGYILVKGYLVEGYDEKVYHLHLRYADDWDELYFRDYLKEEENIKLAYGDLKKQLQKKYPNNREAYEVARMNFVDEYTQKAREAFVDRYLIQIDKTKPMEDIN